MLQELFYNIEYVKSQSSDIIKIIGQRKNVYLGHDLLIDLDRKY